MGWPNGILNIMKLTMDRRNRLVVPKELRDRFALAPGHELEVLLEADGFRLRPVRATPALAEKKGLLICTSALLSEAGDLAAFLGHERNQRSRQVGGF